MLSCGTCKEEEEAMGKMSLASLIGGIGGLRMIIAKTDPIETLEEHTRQLIGRYDKLVEAYEDQFPDQNIWRLLRLAALYHDTGKAYSHFQMRMRKFIGEETDKVDQRFGHIPHNYLSPFFLPLNKLRLDKHSRRVLIEAIAYHHERETDICVEQALKVAKEDLIHHFDQVQRELESLGIQIPEDGRFFKKIADDLSRNRMQSTDPHYLTYIIVKGLLHRLDHAASAQVDIEVDGDFDLSDLTEIYLQRLTKKEEDYLRPLQQFALKHQSKNLILTAQTGMGKTEAALLWAGKKKTFFTVPLRVSLNALYDRVSKEMNYQNCGLLHSSSAHHLDDQGLENWEVIYDQSKHFSNKITFTTIDQILKFPFKFRGYEKYYATLAHSCVIIDEIQAYNPWIVAVIIKALEMLHQIGGKFMIMTATLPKIYLDTMEDKGIIDEDCVVKSFSDDSYLRHRIAVKHETIFDSVDSIAEAAQDQKVLVIVNTVNQAIELYNQLVDQVDHIKLFHSRFIQKDRQLLENELKAFDDDRERPGIWITTQIVEASIDIDFDVLYTELAPLDSLFQRFGRCYRKRELRSADININIFTDEVSGKGSIYDHDILLFSERLLKDHIKNSGPELYESTKMKMVEQLYSHDTLEGTKFYEEFKQALYDLDHIEDYQITFHEAQETLRGDHSVMIIPRQEYDEIIHLFEKLETEGDKRARINIRREIERYTCSVSKRMYRSYIQPIDHYRQSKSGKYPLMSYLYILDRDYDFDRESLQGVGIKKEDDGFEVW